MAFKYLGSLHGGSNGVTRQRMPISSLAVRKGALLKYTAGASSVAIYDDDTKPILGIALNATTTADTEIDVLILPTGALVEADIAEIKDGTTLTANAGSTTTFVDASFVAGDDDILIGARFEVLSMASTDQPVGTVLTATDYTSSSGTIQFASLGTTGFDTGDTIKLLTVTSRMTGAQNLAITPTYADSVTLNGTGAGAGDAFKCYGVSDDGKKVVLAITAGFDQTDVAV